ncbi:hypothetical protein KCP75_25455 [Salmonella enterica subsp. enterica]|nr:hypothetical protein KCP75_25455 [Salmonella enterica subsp. enterica]
MKISPCTYSISPLTTAIWRTLNWSGNWKSWCRKCWDIGIAAKCPSSITLIRQSPLAKTRRQISHQAARRFR